MDMRNRTARGHAGEYRNRALQLESRAANVRDQADRRHMLEMAATLRRTADALAPAAAPTPAELIFKSPPR